MNKICDIGVKKKKKKVFGTKQPKSVRVIYARGGYNRLRIVHDRFVIYFNLYFNVMIKWINSCALIFYSTYSKRLHPPFPQNDQSNNWKLASYINISRYIYTQHTHRYQFRTTYNSLSSISPAFTSSNIIPGCDNTFTHKSNGSVNQLFYL